MKEYREGQKELDQEKECDTVPRDEVRYYMRKSGVGEKYVRVVQNMYEDRETTVRCLVGLADEFKIAVA